MKLTVLMDMISRSQGSMENMLALKATLEDAGISLENIYEELEMSSAYVDSHRDISLSTAPIAPHSHSFYELIYCRSCDNVQYLLGSQRYKLQRGDVILIPPGVSHCPLFPDEMRYPYERIVVWVNEDVIRDLAKRWPTAEEEQRQHRLLRTGGSAWEEQLYNAFRRGCLESEQRQIGWEAALYGNTTYLLMLISRAVLEQKDPGEEHSELLDELVTYVEKNYREKITLHSAARQLLVSESSITHLFRKKMGISFYQYITKRRLSAARRMIEDGTPLSHIGDQSGFCDHSAFYRAFRREYGIAPKEYRKLHLNKQGAGTN